MRLTFLGTGGAGGVPRYGCQCSACDAARKNAERIRRPCSALVESGNTRLLLDAGLMDLHERFAPGSLSAMLLTHFHPDHVQGLLHLRWGKGARIPVICPPDPEGFADLYKHPGLLAFSFCEPLCTFTVSELKMTPLPLNHSRLTLGYAIETSKGQRLAYLTDTLGLPQVTLLFLQCWGEFDLVLDCSFPPGSKGRNHNDLDQAMALAKLSKARTTYLTHLGHELDGWLEQAAPLPNNIKIARDGWSVLLK
ncbi:MAG: phosphonate metabolism protein PhnP [Marinospirillum sp.]|uniref:phosphonate metabolism protein PhnP n=1 Tax=Marinospirillum sp. TaxID=2183934 RepID=UPI001A017F04|nr:phosphonate metabolism protein PhnP [Marinospirillum sp.]MBE0507191.1 phosphonate metabolism protein PhnP [Marinospirillum sp.]